ncbi:MAG TPA: HAD family hydrolase, partial [Amaricoccus sp.]|nr:HAD family hydrolase [Amaricoccus sp.]
MPERPLRIAMWSGPRNLSTAMMRAWGNRADMAEVRDEPFYAAYLAMTGLEHPMREAVLASQPQDWRVVARDCATAPVARGRLLYQKQMTHHMLPGIDREWILGLANVFLIRAPERVLASYAAKRETVTLEDIGFVQQAELFDLVAGRTGRAPPVIDAEAVRADPEGVLRRLCAALGIDFDPAMLGWPAGPRESDGVWAPHWYGAVLVSTGFTPPDPAPPALPAPLAAIAAAAR